jgi:tRNA pseudouridine synthase B
LQKLNGIIVINKPKNYTSHDVVAKVKKLLNIKKVGHTGTLDPNATGVLPLLLNSGTKLSKYLIEHDKEYEVTLKLGIRTDTLDGEGKVLEKKEVDRKILENTKQIEKVLNSFTGKQTQVPPMYSAIKVKGKKLYEYARKGENVEVQPRQIEIYNIELQKVDIKKQEIEFKVQCSKGTYIRTLCEDIATKLGTIGYMKELNRTKVGKFGLEEAITIEKLEEYIENKKYEDLNIITMEELLKEKEKIVLNEKNLEMFLNGVKIKIENKTGIYRIYNENKQFIGTGVVQENKLKRDVIEN